MKVQEAQIMKLQLTDMGELWYADGLDNPKATSDRSGFVSELSMKEHVHIRVMGTRVNAPLITELYQRCCSPRRPGKLEVATPAICMTEQERKDPSIALYRMRQCLLSPSLGGWHEIDELDYPSYAITAQLDRDGHVTDHTKKLLLTHPVLHDMKFLPTLDEDALIYLLAEIIDPRWFVDVNNPYRLAKLRCYLGLTPKHIRQAVSGEGHSVKTARCLTTLNCWRNEEATKVDMNRPGNFLWRKWRLNAQTWKGNITATQIFLVYLIRTWQQRLVSKQLQDLEMFIPASLLKGMELTAYKVHAAKRGLPE